MSKQCICLGDGGLDGKSPYTDLYILAQAKKQNPRVCFLPTASADNHNMIKYFHLLFDRYPCEKSHFEFFNPHTADLEDFFMSMDVIYVGGGHSKTMMGIWKEWGVDKILRAAYENGTVMAGGSAGSVCWFDQCITDSFPGKLSVMDCLGFLPFSNCPHYASPTRNAAYEGFIESKEIKAGYAADDFAGLHFVDGEYFRSISGRKNARTFSVKNIDGKTISTQLYPIYLGNMQNQQDLIFNTEMFQKGEEETSDPEE